MKLVTLRAPSAVFTVRAVGSGAVALQGKPGVVRDDSSSGDRVQIADMSQVREPGSYVLETDAGKSAQFEIGSDVYRYALWLTMRGYYGQRCGCNVDLGNGYSHPACHLTAEFHKTSGKSGHSNSRRMARRRRLWPLFGELRHIDGNAALGLGNVQRGSTQAGSQDS
jgi:hypothetical protein